MTKVTISGVAMQTLWSIPASDKNFAFLNLEEAHEIEDLLQKDLVERILDAERRDLWRRTQLGDMMARNAKLSIKTTR